MQAQERRRLIEEAFQTLTGFQQEGQADFIEALLELFFSSAPQRLREIVEACADGDSQRLEKAAHSLRGSCAALGASLLAELCLRFETAARQGANVDSGWVREIEAEFAAVGAELQRLRAKRREGN